jgi:DNA segregation ATPase FtsK/SpoIIIE, S-DNA-T family
MPEPSLISRQRTALRDLLRLLAERAEQEPLIDQEFQSRSQAAEKEFQERTQQVISRFETDKDTSQHEFQASEERIARRYKLECATHERELQESRLKTAAEYETDSKTARTNHERLQRTIEKTFAGHKSKFEAQLSEAQGRVTEALKTSTRLQREVTRLLEDWHQDRDYGPPLEAGRPDRRYQDAFRHLDEAVSSAETEMGKLRDLRLPGLFRGQRAIWIFAIAAPLFAGAGLLVWGLEDWYFGLIGGLIACLVLVGGACLWLYLSAKNQVASTYLPLSQAHLEIDAACTRAREQARAAYDKQIDSATKLHDQNVQQANDNHQKKMATLKQRRDSALREAVEKHDKGMAESMQLRDTDLRQAHEKYQKLRAEIYAQYESDSHRSHETRYKSLTESKERHEREWTNLIERWQSGLRQFQTTVEEVHRESTERFPEWSDPAWTDRPSPQTVPPGIRFGRYHVDLAQLPGGLSSDERLKPATATQLDLPALLPFPVRGSLLIKSREEGRLPAIQLLQALMLRCLASLPAGKVRFTIIDPIGLGENFGSFMHLADFEESLVTSRIWTEPGHIENRLADLTGHMENVLQKYLRDQFETIEDYNAHAGEVAEPFRILVVANFPANFSAEAARRLVSIVSSGARCGVYAFIGADTALEMPHNFQLAQIEPYTLNLEWNGERFVWKDEDFERFVLKTDEPPSSDRSIALLRVFGERAKEANRVEVPFDFIAPPPEQWWTQDSRSGVSVALGRAGATKRQHLKLGQGTSQHVLLAGKTGSGKSTLLHALITNLSLLYSPDEVELYLIDFKKGVEFKTYAAHELPHARVVAIESEREFGLSVLQRLDAELRARGDRFRQAGTQDLKGYRESNGSVAVPRILLVVDEFQEFFSEDDKVAQEAAGLLDRLVRQGRAFGLHVLLGSQTLGGAYSLARSTIDQMAVRIALQCSEADAQLILSDGNTAARLLSRPGEAIYNDANGLVEGNNPFQVVWLPEPRREEFLGRIRSLDQQRHPGRSRVQVVFEGNAPADIGKNYRLRDALVLPTWPAGLQACQAWLGEAMAIKDPTAAVFRRQAGSNLLVIGQQDDPPRGVLATCLVSLAAQHSPAEASQRASGARFYLLDGSPTDSPHARYLSDLAKLLPHPVRTGGWRDLALILQELTDELERRQKSNESDGPALYLLLFGLHRFRDLRRPEDDFSFGQTEQGPSLPKQFAGILREGSAVGVHVLVWCDTYNNATRTLDRLALREFDMRVLFQMSAADSSNLIDSPAAGKLGMHRATFYSEEEGRLEKFRPYGLPPENWLGWMKEQLARKQPV